MSAISKPTSGIQSTNSFRFSSCSQTAMADYIDALNSYGINCLLDDEKPYNETEWTHEIAVIPGQRYSASEQCKQAFGPTYTVCGGAILGSNVCEKLWCYDTTAPHLGCTASGTSGKAVDGTPCGDKKWCVRGACVYNSSAPAGSDTCPLGDIGKDVHVFTDESYTCSNMPSYSCYNKDVYAVCCKTCGDLYNSAQPRCPYGNRANCSGLTPLSCQDSQIRIPCCSLCSEYVLDIPGCPYGDYYPDCRDYVPRVCSLLPQQCCETCAARQRTTASATTGSAVVPAKTTVSPTAKWATPATITAIRASTAATPPFASLRTTATYTFRTPTYTTNTASTVDSFKTTMSISVLASAVFISRKL